MSTPTHQHFWLNLPEKSSGVVANLARGSGDYITIQIQRELPVRRVRLEKYAMSFTGTNDTHALLVELAVNGQTGIPSQLPNIDRLNVVANQAIPMVSSGATTFETAQEPYVLFDAREQMIMRSLTFKFTLPSDSTGTNVVLTKCMLWLALE